MTYKGNDLDLRTPGAASGPRSSGLGDPPVSYSNGSRPARATGTATSIPPATPGAAYVDETVLACCNHAFNVALSNSAAEVRLEHLVHALTRVEAAARVLEQRGVREAQLRIESATAIASQIPVGFPEGQSQPRASVAFDELLRRASDRAQRYGRSAAEVDDVLQALLAMRADLPGVALFLRHTGDLRPIEPEPSVVREASRPPTVREPSIEPPRYDRDALDSVLQRVDGLTAMLRGLQSDVEAERRRSGEVVGIVHQDLQELRASLHASVQQHGDELMRAFETRLTLDRRAFGDLIADTQRELAGLRTLGTGQRARLDDRSLALLDGLQANLTQHRNSFEGHVGALEARITDRLQTLERHLERTGGASFADLSRATLPLQDRLVAIDKMLTERSDAGNEVPRALHALQDRLGAIERSLTLRDATPPDLSFVTIPLHDRLTGIERALSEQGDPSDRMAERLEAIEIRLAGVDRAVESRLATLDRVAQTTTEAVERSLQQIARAGAGVTAGAAEAAGAAAAGAVEGMKADLAGRFERLEHTLAAQGRGDEGAHWSALEDRMQLVGRSVGLVSAETTRLVSLIAERDPTPVLDRLRVLENVLAAHRSEHGELKTAITGGLKSLERAQIEALGIDSPLRATLEERFQAVARLLETLRTDLDRSVAQGVAQGLSNVEVGLATGREEQARATAMLATVADRARTLEGLLVTASERQLETAQMHELGFSEMQEGLVKLGNNQQTLSVNQQTLAQTLDEWRQERAGDLAIIDNQLRQLSVEVQEPRRAIDSLSDSMQGLHRVVLQQARPRSWFKNWLFGTDTVWEAGWGSAETGSRALPPTGRA